MNNKKLASALLHVLLLPLLCLAQVAWSQTFEELVGELNAKSFSNKSKAIDNLSEIDDHRVLPTLKAMQEANLFYNTVNNTLVIASESNGNYAVVDVLTQQPQGFAEKSDLKKVKINNRLRRKLRSVVAVLELSSEDESLRLLSAKNLIKNPDESLREKLIERLDLEKNQRILDSLELVVAIIDIEQNDQTRRMDALNRLGSSVEPEAVVVVRRLAERDEEGKFIEENRELALLAEKRLSALESKLKTLEFVKNLLFGISLGAVLLLAAIGLAITFGVMGVINMAHGEMIMLGAYTTFAIQQLFPEFIELSLLFAIPSAFLVSGAAGIIIERLVIRHLYGRPLDTLLATFGISLILQQAVRMYNSNNVPVITPEWLSGSFAFNGALSLTYNRIYIVVFSVFVLLALAFLLKKTLVGLQIRAVTQNRPMANSMGIRSGWVDALTFGLGSGIAGIAGVALSQLTNVGPNLGQGYIIDSFMVVVFGGVGNLFGTFFAALSLGVVNKFLEPVVGAVLGKIIVLVFIILFIQWRPRGLFALKGRFVED